MIELMLICNQPDMAQYAIDVGVNRIFIDLEIMGKKARQGHRDTLISHHKMDDIEPVRRAIPNGELLVRLNPFYPGIGDEIESAIGSGADSLMLPMVEDAKSVFEFIKQVDGRAKVIPLVETIGGVNALDGILNLKGLSEIYIGFNDLQISMGSDFMFEPLANGLLEAMVTRIKAAGLPFGFGGIARLGEGMLPAESILTEHVRLGSTSVILSRTFHGHSQNLSELQDRVDFKHEIMRVRKLEETLRTRNEEQIQKDREHLVQMIQGIVEDKRVSYV